MRCRSSSQSSAPADVGRPGIGISDLVPAATGICMCDDPTAPKSEDATSARTAAPQAVEWERLYAALVESSDDAILTKTLDGVVTSWNPGAERMFGFSAAEAIGSSIDIIVPAARRAELH